MDKLKNMLNPGSKKDDEVMYGSGNPDDPLHSGTTGTRSGQGSHFASSRTGGNDPLSSSTNPTSTTGYGSSTTNDPLSSSANPISSTGYGSSTTKDPLSTSTNPTGASQYDTGSTGQGTHGLHEPYASRMPGGFDDDAATTASVSSGVPGHSQSRSGVTGTNDPIFDKPLPREPASAGTGLMGSTGNNTAGTGSSLTGKEYPDRSVGSTGVGHQNYAPDTGRSFPLGGSSNTTSGSQYPSGETGTYPVGGAGGSTTAGPHSSNLANKADPRVDSDLDGSRTTGNTGLGSGTGPTASSTNQGSLGRDTALASGTGARTSMTPGTGTGTGSGLTSGTGTGSGLTSGTGTGSGLTSGTGSGTGMTSGSGYGPDSWRHDHTGHGHQYEGDPCATGEVAPTGALRTAGPHVTDTANRLDPHVGADGTTTGSTGHHHGHHGGDAALAGAGVGAGTGAYESSRDTRSGTTGSGLGSTTSDTTETSSTGKTAGPHKSDLLNKLDPRVDSDLSKQRASTGTTGTGLGSSTTGNTGTSGHHYGRDAGLAGAGGALAYEAEKHHRGNEPTGTTSGMGSTGTTSGLGPTGSTSGMGSTGTTSGLGSTGTRSGLSSSNPYGSSSIDSTGHTSGLGSTGTRSGPGSSDPYGSSSIGSTGHTSGMGSSNPYSSGSGVDPRVDSSRSGYDGTTDTIGSGKGHHLGRDAALGAGAGGLAYEAERAHSKPTQSSTMPSNTTGSGYDNTRGPTGSDYDHAGSALAGSGHQPLTGTTGTSEYDRTQPHTSSHHHIGRDAALGASAGGVGYEAQKLHDTSRTDPSTQVREPTHPGASIATYPSPGYGHEGAQDPTHGAGHHHGHRKEDAAIAGGAGAGAGALAGHELSKKDEKHLEKEHSKELKAHEKERAKHEKAIEKDEKRHEKAEDKHEKKHGGLLGFLHHDKSHKDHATDRRDFPEERSAGIGTTSTTGLEGEHGSQSGVHDIPIGSDGTNIGSGITTHDAYGTQEGHNKLHKDPPAKVLESRGLDHSGSGSGY